MATNSRLPTLKPRLKTLAPRLAPQPRPSQQAGYRIRGRTLQQIRATHFRRNPFCVMCLDQGVVSIAVELDHVIALMNGGADSLDPFDNRQGLCAEHHKLKSIEDLK